MDNNRELGNVGESIAEEILKSRGYQIIKRNFRCRYGEIDIIAKHNGKLVFVEVKTRKGEHYGTPEEAVGYWKQKRIRRLAEYYLIKSNDNHSYCRFDVYSIYLKNDNLLDYYRIIENCF
jgi:putative endonuclease